MLSIAQMREKYHIEGIEITPDLKHAYVKVAYSVHCPKGCGNSDSLGKSFFSTKEIRDCYCREHGDWRVRRAFRVNARTVKSLLR